MPITITTRSAVELGFSVTFAPFGDVDVSILGVGMTYDPTTGAPDGGTLTQVDILLDSGPLSLINFPETDIAVLAGYDFNVVDISDVSDFLAQFKGFDIQLNEEQDFYALQFIDTDDRVFGSSDDDEIFSGAGKDFVQGGLGNDTIDGGDGLDRLFGNGGNDQLIGRLGDDNLFGGRGHDELFGDIQPWYGYSLNGQGGEDRLFGGAGRDRIYGGEMDDYAEGGTGRDNINGGNGNDLLYGGKQSDRLRGDDGNDILHGDEGADEIYGGDDDFFGEEGAYSDDDMLFGGKGGDLLNGGIGNDTMFGGEGDDLLVSVGGSDTMSGDEGNDVLIMQGSRGIFVRGPLEEDGELPFFDATEMSGGAGSDVFVFNTEVFGQLVITDFTDGEDKLQLQPGRFDQFTYVRTAEDQYARFLENAEQAEFGVIYGSEAGVAVLLGASLDDLSAEDFLTAYGIDGFGFLD